VDGTMIDFFIICSNRNVSNWCVVIVKTLTMIGS